MKRKKVPADKDIKEKEATPSGHHSKDRFVANPVVSCRAEGEGAILFNADTDNTTLINGTGLATWHYLAKPRSLDEIASYLLATFRDVPDKAAVIRDADVFISDLLPEFILEVDAGAGKSPAR
jgi:Coenzyme PQQ synthesis protein D (PqqD)